MISFNVGQTYSTRSIGDHDCIYSFEILKRTVKSVIIRVDGQDRRKGLYIYEGVEQFKPHGTYSMCAVISADDPDLSPKPRVEYTSGDWKSTEALRDFEIYADTGARIAYVSKMPNALHTELEKRANVRLIVAAPKLLAACKAMLERMEELQKVTNYPLAWPRVLAADAIAKAEGANHD